jgi:hypothetical protein
VRLEETLHGRPLHALPASVDQPDDAETRRLRLLQILVDHIDHVARLKRVEVNRFLYRNANGLGPLRACRRVIGHSPR